MKKILKLLFLLLCIVTITQAEEIYAKAHITSLINGSTLEDSSMVVKWDYNDAKKVRLFIYEVSPYKSLLDMDFYKNKNQTSETLTGLSTKGGKIKVALYSYTDEIFDPQRTEVYYITEATGTTRTKTKLASSKEVTKIQKTIVNLSQNEMKFKKYRESAVDTNLKKHSLTKLKVDTNNTSSDKKSIIAYDMPTTIKIDKIFSGLKIYNYKTLLDKWNKLDLQNSIAFDTKKSKYFFGFEKDKDIFSHTHIWDRNYLQ